MISSFFKVFLVQAKVKSFKFWKWKLFFYTLIQNLHNFVLNFNFEFRFLFSGYNRLSVTGFIFSVLNNGFFDVLYN